MIWTHMQDKNLLRQVVQHEVVVDLFQYDKKGMYDIVAFHKDKVHHLRYSLKMSYKFISEITILEKKVELCFLNGRRVSPKFITLCRMFMDFKNPDTDKPLIEAIIPSCRLSFYVSSVNSSHRSATSQKLAA